MGFGERKQSVFTQNGVETVRKNAVYAADCAVSKTAL